MSIPSRSREYCRWAALTRKGLMDVATVEGGILILREQIARLEVIVPELEEQEEAADRLVRENEACCERAENDSDHFRRTCLMPSIQENVLQSNYRHMEALNELTAALLRKIEAERKLPRERSRLGRLKALQKCKLGIYYSG
jgi:hypothetical protein